MQSCKKKGASGIGIDDCISALRTQQKRGFSTQVMWARILRIYSVTSNHGTTKIKYIPNNLDGKVGSFG